MKSWKYLLILFISLVIVKSLLASFVLAPSMFSDEYEYAKMARSFREDLRFKVHDFPDKKIELPFMYSIFLSPAYLFSDMRTVYLVMKIINALLSSLAIIPAYLIGKEFMSKKKALLAATLVGIMPATFSYTSYILSENLFIPLMLFLSWSAYKYFINKDFKWLLVSTILLFIAYLTKALAAGFLLLFGILFMLEYLKTVNTYKKIIVPTAIFIITNLLVFLILKFFGFQYTNYLSLPNIPAWQILGNILVWYAIYLGIIVIGTGFIPAFIRPTKSSGNERVFRNIVMILSLIGIGMITKVTLNPSNMMFNTTVFEWLYGRVMSRYLDYILPLVVIVGVATLDTPIKKWRSKLAVAIALASATTISALGLLPVNNTSLSIFGAMKVLYETLVSQINLLSIHYFIFAIATASFIVLFTKALLNPKYRVYIIATFFILTSLFSYAVTAINANTYWYNGEQMQLGLWINDNDEFRGKIFLIDERDSGKILKDKQDALYEKDSATIVGFWLNNPIRIGNTEYLNGVDYVISKQKLSLPLIKQTDSEIYLYQVPKED